MKVLKSVCLSYFRQIIKLFLAGSSQQNYKSGSVSIYYSIRLFTLAQSNYQNQFSFIKLTVFIKLTAHIT